MAAGIVALVAGAAAHAQNAPPATEAVPRDIGDWLGPDSYPPDAIRAGQQGRVVVIVSIDATGHPTACRVDIAIGSPALEQGTCAAVLAKGRFDPARDAKGRAIASTMTLPVRWVLPYVGENRQPAGPLDFRQVVTIGADDTILNCEVFVDGKLQKTDAGQCGGPAANPAELRKRVNMTGGYRMRLDTAYRNGDTPPPLPPLPVDGRVLLTQEARLTIDAAGTPSDCTFAYTGGEWIEQAKKEPGQSMCDANPRFFPVMTKEGPGKPAKVLVATWITLLPALN